MSVKLGPGENKHGRGDVKPCPQSLLTMVFPKHGQEPSYINYHSHTAHIQIITVLIRTGIRNIRLSEKSSQEHLFCAPGPQPSTGIYSSRSTNQSQKFNSH
jgi:hypothetical protein